MTANQGSGSGCPGSPICADGAGSIGSAQDWFALRPRPPALRADGRSASLAKCLCFLCNNNSILCKHLVWPFLLKCAKSFNSHGNANDLEVRGYIHLCEHGAGSVIMQASRTISDIHTGTDPSGAAVQKIHVAVLCSPLAHVDSSLIKCK